MNLRKLLVYQKEIMGVEIDDSRLGLVNLAPGKISKVPKIEQWAEVKLAPHIIENGEAQDEKKLHLAFQRLKKEFLASKGKKRTVPKIIPIILSIPSSKIYSQLFRFPKYLSQEQLEESLNLSINFSLPQPKDEVYFDWQRVFSSQEKEQAVFLSSVGKPVVDAYLRALVGTGFIPLALESRALSLCRVVGRLVFGYIDKNLSILVLMDEKGADLIVSEQGSPHFIYTILWPANQKSKKEFLEQEIWKVANFYQTDSRSDGLKINKVYLISDRLKLSSIKNYLAKESSWKVIILETRPLVVLGAGLRGLVSRKRDTDISLMPVGTEKEYDNQLTISFLDFVGFWLLGISVITLLLLGGTYQFISSINQNLETRLNQSYYISLSPEVKKMQSEMTQFNKNVDLMSSSIEGQLPLSISELLKKLEDEKIPGIALNRFQIFSEKDIILEGKAETRSELLEFKDGLAKANLFSEVDLPLKFLVREKNLVFTINLKLESKIKN